MQQVTKSLRTSGSRMSDQSAVWAGIDKKLARLGARSETAAMSAMYEDLKHPLDEFVSAFHELDGQVGTLVLVNGRNAGLELLDSQVTWKKLAPKLVRSYALDAIDRSTEPATPATLATARALIKAITASQGSVFEAVGEGSDVRLTGIGVAGAALVARGRTIHLSAFAVAR